MYIYLYIIIYTENSGDIHSPKHMNDIWLCKWGYEATSLASILSWSHEIPWGNGIPPDRPIL